MQVRWILHKSNLIMLVDKAHELEQTILMIFEILFTKIWYEKRDLGLHKEFNMHNYSNLYQWILIKAGKIPNE